MRTNGTKTRLATISVAALMALAVVPVLAASASAAAAPASVVPAAGSSGAWAYGGQGYSSGKISLGPESLSWNASATVDVVYNATNTTPNITEVKVTRTVVVSVAASYAAPNVSWNYNFKAAEDDQAYANLTDAATVTAQPSGTNVTALGLMNASLHANASVVASLVGSKDGQTASAYLNASGWAKAQVALTPALGLIPLNLTGISSWTSSAMAAGSAAWNLSWSWVDHDFNGTGGSRSGDVNGTWSTATEVTLNGGVAPSAFVWSDHRARTAIGLATTGPFDLHGGFVLVPHGFDLFGGANARGFGDTGVGSTVIASEYIYVNAGPVSARSVTAANLTASAQAPTALAPSGDSPAAEPQADSPTPTVWAQPMSPSAAEHQATCAQYGCAASPGLLGQLVLPLAIAGVVAVAAIALIAARRPRKGTAADVPLGAAPIGAAAVTPPTGMGSDPTPGPLPPQP
jgi:hypothetical protein